MRACRETAISHRVSDGKVETRIDDGYHDFHWSHHPQPDWPENAYTQWLESKGKSWDELYTGRATKYVKEGVPAEYHQTTWCAEMAMDFIHSNAGSPWFFSFNCFDPHHPFDPPAEYLKKYDSGSHATSEGWAKRSRVENDVPATRRRVGSQ